MVAFSFSVFIPNFSRPSYSKQCFVPDEQSLYPSHKSVIRCDCIMGLDLCVVYGADNGEVALMGAVRR